MKTYDKEQVLKEVKRIMDYLDDNQQVIDVLKSTMGLLYGEVIVCPSGNKNKERKLKLELAQLLLTRYNSGEDITLSKEEIEYFLIDKEERILNSSVLSTFRSMGVDMQGVCLDYLYLQGLNLRGLENIRIDLDRVMNKSLIGTRITNAEFVGSWNNFKIYDTKIEDCKSEKPIDPQEIYRKSMTGSCFGGIEINGKFDWVKIGGSKFDTAKGIIRINPQKCVNKNLDLINFANCYIVGDQIPGTDEYEEASFEGCKIRNASFQGAKNKVTIDLDKVSWPGESSIYDSKIESTDLTGVTVKGTVTEEELSRVILRSYIMGDNDNRIYLRPPYENESIQLTVVKNEEKPKEKKLTWVFFKKNKVETKTE